MTVNQEIWSDVYRRSENIVAREVAGETILVPIRGNLADLHKVYTINPVGAVIWGQLDGTKSLAAIRDALLERYDSERRQVDEDLSEFITMVAREGLAEKVG